MSIIIDERKLTKKATSKIKQGLKDIKEGRIITLEKYTQKRFNQGEI